MASLSASGTFPAYPANPPSACSESTASARRRVVLLDDEPGILKTWKMILELQGWQVVCCEHAADALDAVGQGCDCLMTDFRMPDMNGIEVMRAVRKFSGVPMMMMSAHDSAELRKEAEEVGAGGIISKPAPIAEVIALLEKLCPSRKG